MKFSEWCKYMQIEGDWKTKLRQSLTTDGHNVDDVDETIFIPTWDLLIKQKPDVSKYAIAERLGISRQAVGQWPNFDNSDKDQTAAYLRTRAVKTRERGLVALELSKKLGEAAVHCLAIESKEELSPKDIAKRLGRTPQYVSKWGIALSPDTVAAHCRQLQQHNADLGQAYIDRGDGMIAIAREIEEGKW